MLKNNLQLLNRRVSIYPGYLHASLLAFFVLFIFVPGGLEKFTWPVNLFFNIYSAIVIPTGIVLYKIYNWHKTQAHSRPGKLGPRISKLMGMAILMAIVEILGYTLAFVEGVLVFENRDSLFAKIPFTIIELYTMIFVGIPLVSSFYELQIGEKDTLIGVIYRRSKNRMPPRMRKAAQDFYRTIQVPV